MARGDLVLDLFEESSLGGVFALVRSAQFEIEIEI